MNPQEYQDYINNRKPEQIANDIVFRQLLLIGLATLVVTLERLADATEALATQPDKEST